VQHGLGVAGERAWLCEQTRRGELMGQVVAARKFDAPTDYTGIAPVRFIKSRWRSASVSSFRYIIYSHYLILRTNFPFDPLSSRDTSEDRRSDYRYRFYLQ
jgi:hypothetical protein